MLFTLSFIICIVSSFLICFVISSLCSILCFIFDTCILSFHLFQAFVFLFKCYLCIRSSVRAVSVIGTQAVESVYKQTGTKIIIIIIIIIMLLLLFSLSLLHSTLLVLKTVWAH